MQSSLDGRFVVRIRWLDQPLLHIKDKVHSSKKQRIEADRVRTQACDLRLQVRRANHLPMLLLSFVILKLNKYFCNHVLAGNTVLPLSRVYSSGSRIT